MPNDDETNSQFYVLDSEFTGTPAINLSERVTTIEEKCDGEQNLNILTNYDIRKY